MREYELLVIMNPDLEETAAIDLVERLLTDTEATLANREVWGLRTLAYPINRQNRGRYILFRVNIDDPTKLTTLQQELLIHQDEIMRFSLVASRAKDSQTEAEDKLGE